MEANECKDLLQKFRDKTHDENQNRRLMGNAMKLVKELQDTAQNQEERWERIGKTWMEMLGYAARKSKSNNHTQQLRRGGEFISHGLKAKEHANNKSPKPENRMSLQTQEKQPAQNS
ncbi:hypothetical protein Dsin_014506 [Dipteronia sinensis]|uniref:Uncharacterized protein n=1 Tax=Dipteronia sinensis TaxID=43782 RepID=A0AAE0E9Z8_9ROSI|nr:hypothetical protein Dsin_014506 [Dipteronia sinensis]